MDQRIHVVHESIGDKNRRESRETGVTLIAVSILLFMIGVIGALMNKDFKFAFWSFLISIGLFVIGKWFLPKKRHGPNHHTFSFE